MHYNYNNLKEEIKEMENLIAKLNDKINDNNCLKGDTINNNNKQIQNNNLKLIF